MPKTIFLDTNIYLHYKDVDQINWVEMVNTDLVTIIVPAVVIDELNKHKDLHPRPRVKKRAATVLKRLSKLFEYESQVKLKDKVTIWHEDRHPTGEFTTYSLDPNFQDDQLLTTILMYRAEFSDTETVLVAADTGLNLRAKARRYGIAVVLLDDTYKLAEEPDPAEEENKKLRQQLQDIQNRMPRLSLTFSNKGDHLTIHIPPPKEPDINIRQEIINLKEQFPKATTQSMIDDAYESLGVSFETMFQAALSLPSQESIDEYNHDLERFYNSYESYLDIQRLYKILKPRTIKIGFCLENSGTTPAENIDIRLYFPDDLKLRISEDPLPLPPQPPQPPAPPERRGMFEYLGDFATGSTIYNPDWERIIRNVTPPWAQPAEEIIISGTMVKISLGFLKHADNWTSDQLFLTFGIPDQSRSFQISYQITVANLPKPIDGRLHVIVQKEYLQTD